MKVLTFLGTRPEIIRLSEIIRVLDLYSEHVVVHTGQNFDPLLSDVFFSDLGLREPDVHLGIESASFHQQIAQILERGAEAISSVRPDRILILGDTNSGLVSLVAARMGIPVFHLEAGNRCYDNRVPEEVNRRVIDHCSDVLMPYTHRSKENLIREGIDRRRVFVVGNPIREVLDRHSDRIDASTALDRFGVEPRGYFVATVHRAENVDDPTRLGRLVNALGRVGEIYELPVLVSVHPRTADRLRRSGLDAPNEHVRLLDPLGFLDFASLERRAKCVLTDSGTVQEECAILGVPNVTLRDVTERPETLECGSNILSGSDPHHVVLAVRMAVESSATWEPPAEYMAINTSGTVSRIVLGYHESLHGPAGLVFADQPTND